MFNIYKIEIYSNQLHTTQTRLKKQKLQARFLLPRSNSVYRKAARAVRFPGSMSGIYFDWRISMSKKNKKKSYGTMRRPGFARDMPADCKKCYFWNQSKRNCSLGGLDNCYYRISPPKKKTDPCERCSYGKHRACVGNSAIILTVICLS